MTLTLPPGRTLEEAVTVARKHRQLIWEGKAGAGLSDDQRLELLEKICCDMLNHEPSGKRLAQMAIWS